MLLFFVTPCLLVAVQPCMEWIPIIYIYKKEMGENLDKKKEMGENLGNCYSCHSYFSHSMGTFFPSDFHHPMVCFITWVNGKLGRTWEIGTHAFPIVWVLFSMSFPSYMVYFITWEMHGFSHQFPMTQEKCNKSHHMGRTWEIGPKKYSCFWKCMWWKNLHPGGCKIFLLINLIEIFKYSLNLKNYIL